MLWDNSQYFNMLHLCRDCRPNVPGDCQGVDTRHFAGNSVKNWRPCDISSFFGIKFITRAGTRGGGSFSFGRALSLSGVAWETRGPACCEPCQSRVLELPPPRCPCGWEAWDLGPVGMVRAGCWAAVRSWMGQGFDRGPQGQARSWLGTENLWIHSGRKCAGLGERRCAGRARPTRVVPWHRAALGSGSTRTCRAMQKEWGKRQEMQNRLGWCSANGLAAFGGRRALARMDGEPPGKAGPAPLRSRPGMSPSMSHTLRRAARAGGGRGGANVR